MIRNDTHEVRIDRDRGLVVKRFRSARRGEPVREWTALSLLDRFAAGLAPAPVSADLDSDFPVVTMSLLPGTELSAAPVTPAQACALAEALERLWRSVPSAGRELPAVTPNPVAFAHQVGEMLAARLVLGDDPAVVRAHATAAAWLGREALERTAMPVTTPSWDMVTRAWPTTYGTATGSGSSTSRIAHSSWRS